MIERDIASSFRTPKVNFHCENPLNFTEAIVKIIGLRHFYFTVPWNVFDFILVLASIVDLLVGDLTVEFPIPPTMLRIVRVFRIGRVLRLVKVCFTWPCNI